MHIVVPSIPMENMSCESPLKNESLPTHMTREEEVYGVLVDVMDPEIGINVVDLGLVYGVEVDAEG
ncbi:MAG: iron-sulfur cluster assembly protein, partial [Vulcanimicrobiaceae bacterium]